MYNSSFVPRNKYKSDFLTKLGQIFLFRSTKKFFLVKEIDSRQKKSKKLKSIFGFLSNKKINSYKKSSLIGYKSTSVLGERYNSLANMAVALGL